MKQIKWNDNWKFFPEDNAFALVWAVPADARDVTLPHDAMLEQPPRADSPNKARTGYRDGGNYNYEKKFFVPAEEAGARHILRFDGVYAHAMVYVNQQYAGGSPYGYTTFDTDLSDLLIPGRENTVRVQVKNGGMPNSRWYSGSGIYRDVWLLKSGQTYIEPEGVQITTECADRDLAVLAVRTTVRNAAPAPRTLRLRLELAREGSEAPAAGEATLFFLRGGESRTLVQRIAVPEPALWSAEDPALYRWTASLYDGEELLDASSGSYGIRTLRLDALRGLRVNGEPVKLRGSCIHHDSGLLGAATYYDAHVRQLTRMKEAGFNAIRMSHHPAAPALLDACDRVGMYVMDEFSDIWTRCKSELDYAMDFAANWRCDAERMVRKDFNHPSVILYSVGNEIPEIGTEAGSGVCAAISERLHALDPTRYTTAGINGIFVVGDRMGEIVADLTGGASAGGGFAIGGDGEDVNEVMAIMGRKEKEFINHPILSRRLELACAPLDVAGYNYMTSRYEPDAARYPNRIMVGSETYPPEIARNWELVQRLPQLIGDFTWTGWDYIGETGIGIPAYGLGGFSISAPYPAILAYVGDIDITGFRRPASYYREIVFGLRQTPYASVQDPARHGEQRGDNPWILTDAVAAWDWKGYEGKPVTVEVYSPGDEVELFLNGVSLGRKPLAACKAEFEAVYAPGELRAAAYDQGRDLGSFTLRTPEAGRRLRIETDFAGKELLYLAVEKTDRQGRTVAGEDEELTAEVAGAELLGFGSGDHSPRHPYQGRTAETWHGRALMILRRKAGQALRVRLAAQSGLTAEYAEVAQP